MKMKKILLLPFVGLFQACAVYTNQPVVYETDQQATQQAPWKVNEKTWQGSCKFIGEADRQCHTIFLGITATGQVLIQNFYDSNIKASDPYLVVNTEAPRCSQRERLMNKWIDGKYIAWYEGGQKKSESFYQEGREHGISIDWHVNGQKNNEFAYIDGKLNGLWINWRDNGQKSFETYYKDGEKNGLSVSYQRNGQKKSEFLYKDGRLNGVATLWYDDGRKLSEMHYKDARLDGFSTIWHSNGTIAVESFYDNGIEVRRVTH